MATRVLHGTDSSKKLWKNYMEGTSKPSFIAFGAVVSEMSFEMLTADRQTDITGSENVPNHFATGQL